MVLVACEEAPGGEVGKKNLASVTPRDAHSLLTRPLSARPARPRLHPAISPSTQRGPITGPGYLALNPAGSMFAG